VKQTSEDDHATLDLSFELLNRRIEDIFLVFGPLCSFTIFFALPTRTAFACFFCFLFFSRALNAIILSLKANYFVTSAATVSNLRLLATYKYIDDENNRSDLQDRMLLSEKIRKTLDAFNTKQDEKHVAAHAWFEKRTIAWYFEYMLYIIPAAFGYYLH
jgi:hypothetical protein